MIAGHDSSRALEAGVCLDHLHSVTPQPLRRVVRLDPLTRLVYVRDHAGEVDLRVDRRESHRWRLAHPLGEIGRGQQALARNAAGPEALAARAGALHQGHPGAGAGSDQGRHEAGGPAADTTRSWRLTA